MLAIQHILIFTMLYIVLISLLNFEQKREIKWVNLVIFILLLVADVIRQIHYGYQPIRNYDSLIGPFFVFFACLYMLNGFKSWSAWVAIAAALLFSFFISNISTGFLFGILDIDVTLIQSYGQYSALNVLLGLLLLSLLSQMSKALGLKIDVFSLTFGDIVLILIFLSLFIFYISGSYQLGVDFGGVRGLTIKTLTLLGGVVGTYLIIYTATQKSIIKDIRGRKNQQELIFHEQEQNYERMQLRNAEIKKFRHNIADELIFLQGLLSSNALNEAQNYVKTMQNELVEIDQVIGEDTGSRVTNTSWHTLTTSDKYRDIATTWRGKIPVNFSMQDRDMVLLFSNLLNNAFEAASQSTGSKYVEVHIRGNANTLSLSIKNSYAGKVKQTPNGHFVTSKKDKENHGIGTRIVKDVVAKYDGEIGFYHPNNEFTVLINLSKLF